MQEMKLTPEQEVILDSVRSRSESIMIEALAGTGKTTTLKLIGQEVPSSVNALGIAFNVKIRDALEKALPSNFTVKTMNGLGHSAWSKAIGQRLQVEPKKLGNLITQIAKSTGRELSNDQWDDVRRLTSAAMLSGLVPKAYEANFIGFLPDTLNTWEDLAEGLWIPSIDEKVIEFCRQVLTQSVKLSFSGIISYDDQIYMSVCYGGVFPKFPLVLVDEAQDLSRLNAKQVERVSTDRLIVCGDQRQSIYAFRGADHQSMQNLKKLRSDWLILPLATTFRCPKAVVARQLEHVPMFRAFDGNKDGQVHRYPKNMRPDPATGAELYNTELDSAWNWTQVLEDLHDFNGKDIAILSRNNAPLMAMAFKLIRQKIGCQMLGRDIGKGLIQLSKKILPEDNTSQSDCARAIRKWQESESALAMANGKEDKLDVIEDKAESLRAVLEHVETAGSLRQLISDLFSRQNSYITLSTIHKAKGLEYDLVLHLDPWRIPSKYARNNPDAMQQEMNMKYVAETRSKHTLILANLEDFQ